MLEEVRTYMYLLRLNEIILVLSKLQVIDYYTLYCGTIKRLFLTKKDDFMS